MKFVKTSIADVFLVEFDRFDDNRGYLSKLFDKNEYSQNRNDFNITQVKYVFTKKLGTIRGLHIQIKPYEEAKIVRCVRGKVFDVVVDVRKKSKTFGSWLSTELSEKDNKCIYVPKGFAHGYQTLSSNTEVLYLMTGKFSSAHNVGIRWDDPLLSINWPKKVSVIAKKDRIWPFLKK